MHEGWLSCKPAVVRIVNDLPEAAEKGLPNQNLRNPFRNTPGGGALCKGLPQPEGAVQYMQNYNEALNIQTIVRFHASLERAEKHATLSSI
jgi:hypothetical protein